MQIIYSLKCMFLKKLYNFLHISKIIRNFAIAKL